MNMKGEGWKWNQNFSSWKELSTQLYPGILTNQPTRQNQYFFLNFSKNEKTVVAVAVAVLRSFISNQGRFFKYLS